MEDYLRPSVEGVNQATAGDVMSNAYFKRSGNASGNIDGANVCPTVNPTR